MSFRRSLCVVSSALLTLTMLHLAPAAGAATVGAGTSASGGHVSGWASFGPTARVLGGVVRVQSLRGRDLIVPADRGTRTSKTGTFGVRVRTLPRRYVVTVTGGRVGDARVRGAVRALVTKRPGAQVIDVTPVSTLIAASVRRQGSVRRARREVRRHLAIPAAVGLSSVPRRSRRLFDGMRFLREADRAGGIGRYTTRMVARVGGRPRPMRARTTATAAGSFGASDLLANLALGAAKDVGFDGMGMILSALGLGQPSALAQVEASLAQLQTDITAINTRLTALQTQVSQVQAEVTAGSYAELDSQLGLTWVGGPEDEILQGLSWLVDNAHGCTQALLATCVGGIPANTDPGAWCASDESQRTPVQAVACDALARLESLLDGNDVASLQNRLVGADGDEGVLQAYLSANGAAITSAGGFITAGFLADATTLERHYAWITALLSQYAMEYGVAEGEPLDLLGTQVGVAQQNVAALQGQLPEALPPYTVIDTTTQTMWSLLGDGAPACQNQQNLGPWLWFPAGSDQLTDPAGCQAAWTSALSSWNGLSGWSQPSSTDLQTLLRTPSRRTAWPSPMDLLETQFGAPNLISAAAQFSLPYPNTLLPMIMYGGYVFLEPQDVDVDDGSNVGPGSYPGEWVWNPGTTFGLGSSTCPQQTWQSGVWDASGAVWNVSGPFCQYIGLANGGARSMCLSGTQSPNYAPTNPWGCNMPIREDSGWPSSGPLDFGHPLFWVVKRSLAGGYAQWVSPASG